MLILWLTLGVLLIITLCSILNKQRVPDPAPILNTRVRSVSEKILVVLPEGGLIETLLRQAYVPQRLTFLTRVSQNHPQVRSIPSVSSWGGSNVIRHLLLAKGYKDEPYIACLGRTFRPLANWDIILQRSYEQSKVDIITAFCTERGTLPTFPCIDPTIKSRIPHFKPRELHREGFMYPSPALSADCFFGKPEHLAVLLRFPLPHLTPQEDEFILMTIAHSLGWSIGCPYSAVGTVRKVTQHNPAPADEWREVTDKVLNILTEHDTAYYSFAEDEYPAIIDYLEKHRKGLNYLQWLGYDFKKNAIKGSRILGVSDQPSENEIQHKYGSRKTFDALRAQYCFD